jgi:ferrous iron transport protein B
LSSSYRKVALIGNPNTGKSTLFNALTGLNQKIGNFAGVTVDKKSGRFTVQQQKIELIDLPGIYSLYPKSIDESIAYAVLSNPENPDFPDAVIIVADASNLKRNLLLYAQVAELKLPSILVLNMVDQAQKDGLEIDINRISEKIGIPVIACNARKQIGLEEIKQALVKPIPTPNTLLDVDVSEIEIQLIPFLMEKIPNVKGFDLIQKVHQYGLHVELSANERAAIAEGLEQFPGEFQRAQTRETILRYNLVNELLYDTVHHNADIPVQERFSNKIDYIITHKILGIAIFLGVLFLVFQAIFTFSALPMEWVELGFLHLSNGLAQVLPSGPFTELLINGIIPGLSGVLIFVPQIAILFMFITILEDSGYMARVSFMMDKLMRSVGLNGKSVVPLMSGIACAVPAIMATRTIESWKERLITILVIPFMSCSARLPVFTLLISLMVPSESVWGIFNVQGLVLMGFYLMGFLFAIATAYVLKWMIQVNVKSYFVMELPVYRWPRFNNVFINIWESSKTFVLDAGKVIMAISIILWVLSSYGPADIGFESYAKEETNIETSFAGHLGKVIEPAIRPLGYDWKIGIALITSFAAREVFVGTMATIYSVDSDTENLSGVKEKMKNAVNRNTGKPVFDVPTSFSLLMFYLLAMQCVSTLAVVKRETKSWKWPIIQLVFMSTIAYLVAFITYQSLS